MPTIYCDYDNEQIIKAILKKDDEIDEQYRNKYKIHENELKYQAALKKEERRKREKRDEEQKNNIKLIYPKSKPLRCKKCDTFKAYPEQFLNTIEKCVDCYVDRNDYMKSYKETKKEKCICGLTYLNSSNEAKIKHELSDAHKRNMKYILKANGRNYNIPELRKICIANNIFNACRMNKETIVMELNKLDNIIIPSCLNF